MHTVRQHEYETLDSAIQRARTAHLQRNGHVRLECQYEGTNVAVVFGQDDPTPSFAEVQTRLMDAKMGAPVPATDEETGENSSPWSERAWTSLHPMLREVVLATLRQAREKYALSIAESAAQQVAMLSSMNDLLESSGDKGKAMAASMSAGMSQTLEGAQAGKRAVCAAYDLAIAELEQQ